MIDNISGSLLAKSTYGTNAVSMSNWEKYANALLVIAGADGEVSPPELSWLLNEFADLINAPDSFRENLRNFQFQNFSLEEVLQNIDFPPNISYKRLLLYDAIRMSYADGVFSDDEKEAVYAVAKQLDVPLFYAQAIEGLANTERSLKTIRASLFEISKDVEAKQRQQLPDMEEVYELLGLDEFTDEMRYEYGVALMLIAGADGLVSEEELQWYLNSFVKGTKTPEHIVERVKAVDYRHEPLKVHLNKISKKLNYLNFSRLLIYSAIQMAQADGEYAPEEEQAVKHACEMLNISPSIAQTITYLVTTEDNINKMRKTLFSIT
jgi:tellurite resistance protein